MINFFGTNRVVPNGYIYTSHKGSEYIYFEGIWFNHKNMKMIDPNKAPQMHEAAKKQIIEHNCNNKQMIGESFKFTGKTYTYVGKNRYTEDGILTESSVLSEVIADDQRVYDVSRETLDKEWNDLHFFILPPHTEDISIPAGLEVNGYRFIANPSRFVSLKDGTVANNVLAKKLWADGMRLVNSKRSEAGNDILPINSTIMLRDQNKRGTWNGTDFRANDGSVIVDANKSQTVKQRYAQFVKQNPAEFPSLTGAKPEDNTQGAGKVQKTPQKPFQPQVMSRNEQRSAVHEASGNKSISDLKLADRDNLEIPNGFFANKDMYLQDGKWRMMGDNYVETRPEIIKKIEDQAREKIRKYNETAEVPINSTLNYKGETITWDGDSWMDDDGMQFDGQLNRQIGKYVDSALSELKNGKSEPEAEPSNSSEPEPEQTPEPENNDPQSEPSADPSPEPENPGTGSSSSTIPDGYSLTSKAGVQYTRKNGQWISSQTKKPMNSSAAKSIDMAAERQIAEFNKSSPVKIGDKWKSGKGKEYTYVGNDRFISSDGKLVPKSSAAQILDKMKAERTQTTDEVPPNTTDDSTAPEPQGTPAPEPSAEPTSEPTNEPSASNEPAPSGASNGLESLAKEIKAHPEARKITVLMTRGDKVSLLAADLILSGKQQDAIKILKALNSNDE